MDILVTGGTGTVGSEVVSRLVERGVSPRVLTRSPDQAREEGPEEARYVGGDLADPASLEGAFADSEKVFLLTPNRPDEADLGRTAVAAADRAGVDHVVFLSIYRVEEIPEATHFEAKIETGNALRERGLAHTEIRASSFYQNDLWFRSEIIKQGIYPQPLGRIGVSRVDIRDVADASVNALLEPGHKGKIYPVLGPTPMTGPEIAARWSEALGTDVRYGETVSTPGRSRPGGGCRRPRSRTCAGCTGTCRITDGWPPPKSWTASGRYWTGSPGRSTTSSGKWRPCGGVDEDR